MERLINLGRKLLRREMPAEVIAYDFLRRFSVWATDPNRNPISEESILEHNGFLRQAETFGVEGKGMLLSQNWCDAVSKKYGVPEVNIIHPTRRNIPRK